MLPNYSKIVSEFKGVKEDAPKKKKSNHVPPKNQRNKTDDYSSFVSNKIPSMNETINEWSTKELLYYFRYHAERNGYRYIITNYPKEMHLMKSIRSNFSNIEICAMIEFLYESEQTYLRKDTLTPSVLSSSWVNSIYADTKLWANDNYKPNKKHKREWSESPVEEVTIGEWK